MPPPYIIHLEQHGVCAPALQLSNKLRAAGIYPSVVSYILLQIEYAKIVGQSQGFPTPLLLDRSSVTPVTVTPVTVTLHPEMRVA